jgi:hypothetical protein
MEGLASEYNKTLDMLASIDAPVKLIIAGNHDRTLDKTWAKNHEKSFWGKKWEDVYEEAREMWFGAEGRAVKEGVRMLEEGIHEVKLGNGGVLKVSHLFVILSIIFCPCAALGKHLFTARKRYNNQHVAKVLVKIMSY